MRRLAFFALTLAACSSTESAVPADAGAEDTQVVAIDALADTTTSDAASTDTSPAETSTSADSAADSSAVTDSAAVTESGADATSSKKTTIRVHYPAGGKTLSLRGSVGPWTWDKGVALAPSANDTWTLETETLTVAAEWKPLLDDTTWARGPNYTVKPGETLDVYPHFTTAKGRVEKRWPALASTNLGGPRAVWVYYPPTYLENGRARFPVVYMHDGQNLFDPATAFGGNEWKVDETIDAAAESGAFREAIVVAPENGPNRIGEYTPTSNSTYAGSGNGDKYLAFLVDELKPKADAELRTLTGRESTAIMGSSLGGLISAYAGTKKAATFGLIGAMSPSTWWDGKVILSLVSASQAPLPLRVYVDSGDSGSSNDDVANTSLLAQAYRGLGFVDDATLKYVVQPGATHSEVYWAQRLPGALAFLLGPR